jgi:DNA-binding transcriptional LysR family regulator
MEFKLRGERVLADLEEARDAVAQASESIVGALRVAVPLSFLRHAAPILAELAEQNPRLKIEAAYSDARVDLIAERFDCAIRIGSLPDSSLVARRIAPIRAALVASPEYLDRRGRPTSPAELAAHELLVRTGLADGDAWRLSNKDGQQISITPSGRFKADNGEALLHAALAGLGVARLPTFLLSDHVGSGALEHVLLDWRLPASGIYLVRPPGAAPGKVRALTDLLVERFGGEPFWDRCREHLDGIEG